MNVYLKREAGGPGRFTAEAMRQKNVSTAEGVIKCTPLLGGYYGSLYREFCEFTPFAMNMVPTATPDQLHGPMEQLFSDGWRIVDGDEGRRALNGE